MVGEDRPGRLGQVPAGARVGHDRGQGGAHHPGARGDDDHSTGRAPQQCGSLGATATPPAGEKRHERGQSHRAAENGEVEQSGAVGGHDADTGQRRHGQRTGPDGGTRLTRSAGPDNEGQCPGQDGEAQGIGPGAGQEQQRTHYRAGQRCTGSEDDAVGSGRGGADAAKHLAQQRRHAQWPDQSGGDQHQDIGADDDAPGQEDRQGVPAGRVVADGTVVHGGQPAER